MAEEVEMMPVSGIKPPKADPLAKPMSNGPATIKITPIARKPGPGSASSPVLNPGLKLPPKPVIRKPGATVAGASLPKPITPIAAKPAAAPAPAKPVAPVSVDVQGLGKLPTISAGTVARGNANAAPVAGLPKPMETLKSVTQKLKGITQEIPQQAVLHKTGIIAENSISEGQKEAAKHKTARISLSDAMGVAPVKNEAAPMKTIRIKRPINIPTPTPTTSLTPQPKAEEAPAAADSAAPNITQRKTLKITRPDGIAVRPGGKFGIKRPGQPSAPASEGAPVEDAVADIPDDIPNVPASPVPVASAPAAEAGPVWLWTLSAIVQLAACVVIGALAWFLYENTQMQYF